MSQYTTGELAKLCGITVRTVQFYDAKDLLHPSELTEGGRRLYSEGDLGRMRLICLLKSLGLSLDAVRGILDSDRKEAVLALLLDQQALRLDEELRQTQRTRDAVEAVRISIRDGRLLSVNSIRDIESMMNGNKKLRRTHQTMLTVGILLDIAEIGTLLLWIFRGIWQPFAVTLPLAIAAAAALMRMYHRTAAYICPECGTKFQPSMKELFFSRHNPRTRKLRCPGCGKTGWCVETYPEAPERT